MISKFKKIVYGGSFLAACGLMIPVLLEQGESSPRAVREEVPADGGGGSTLAAGVGSSLFSEWGDDGGATDPEEGSVSPMVSLDGWGESEPGADSDDDPIDERPRLEIVRREAEPRDSGAPELANPELVDPALAGSEPSSSPAPASERGSGELAVGLERTLMTLENFAPAAVQPDLDSMVLAPLGVPEPTGGDEPVLRGPAELGALTDFLEEHPLNGLIHGGASNAALMGGRVVREGDSLLPGIATVEAINARGVILNYRGSEVRVDLPPLRPRSSSPGSGTSGTDGADANGADTNAEGAGDA